jgi:hypothetical protein
MKTNESNKAADRPVIRKVSRGFQITLPPEFRERLIPEAPAPRNVVTGRGG